MFYFILNRFIRAIPILLGVTLFSFFAVRAVPGDPVELLLGERGKDPKIVEKMNQSLGLDKTLIVQYFFFLKSVLRGDLGHSIITAESVSKEFFSYFPATLELSFFALLWSFILGIPLGLIAAVKVNSIWDRCIVFLSLFGFSMSIFWWALVLILIFSVSLEWTPVSGRLSVLYEINHVTGLYVIDAWFSENSLKVFLNSLQHLLLPSLTLGTIPLAFIIRTARSSALEVLKKDFIRTAKAKGLNFYAVFFRHTLFNALIPILTVVGFLTAALLTGAVLTETIFSWPGIGQWFVTALFARDYPVIMGGSLLMAFIVIGINIAVDLSYVIVDPQIRSNLV